MSDVKKYLAIKDEFEKVKDYIHLRFELLETDDIKKVMNIEELTKLLVHEDINLLEVVLPIKTYKKLKISQRKIYYRIELSEDGIYNGLLFNDPLDENPKEVKILKIESL